MVNDWLMVPAFGQEPASHVFDGRNGRGRDEDFSPPPAQIPASAPKHLAERIAAIQSPEAMKIPPAVS